MSVHASSSIARVFINQPPPPARLRMGARRRLAMGWRTSYDHPRQSAGRPPGGPAVARGGLEDCLRTSSPGPIYPLSRLRSSSCLRSSSPGPIYPLSLPERPSTACSVRQTAWGPSQAKLLEAEHTMLRSPCLSPRGRAHYAQAGSLESRIRPWYISNIYPLVYIP